MRVEEEIDKLKADRAARMGTLTNSHQAGEVWIALAILFAGCFIAESLDRVALMRKGGSDES